MLLKQEQLTKAEKKKIDKFIATTIGKSIDTVLGQASKVLGEITNQLGLTIAPKFEKGILRRMDLIPVADGKLLAILSVESGLARSILIELESHINDKDLIQLEAVLNERLAGLPLGQIRKTIRERLSDTPCNPKLIKLFISPDEAIWTAGDPKILYLKGTDNLLAQPEFSDRNKLLGFLKFLEEKEELVKLLESRTLGEGIVITIGTESAIDQIQNCSLVTTRYKAGKMTGAIGIIGPTRMQYSKLISIVDYTARSLTEALSEL
jgi:heat-inducible transcriptional repressor